MKINVNNEELLQMMLEPSEFEDMNFVIKLMIEEGLSLEDWVLAEIPTDRVYLFEHINGDKFFDIYFIEDGVPRPQYFKEVENWNGNLETYINVHDAKTIKEAIERYEVGE